MKKIIIVILALFLVACKNEVSYERIHRESKHELAEMMNLISIKPTYDNPLRQDYSCKFISSYNYGKAVPSSESIEEDYFNNVIMGGDSRMGSLALYSDLGDKGAEIYYVTSLSIWRIYDMNVDNAKEKGALFDLINNTKRKNIYFFVGINEINGTNMDVWQGELDNFVAELKKKHANDNIYLLLGYYPRSMNGMSTESLINAVKEENKRIINVAKKHRVLFLDLNDSKLIGDDGLLKEELTWDGVHLSTDGAKILADYISTHVFREERYVQEICE